MMPMRLVVCNGTLPVIPTVSSCPFPRNWSILASTCWFNLQPTSLDDMIAYYWRDMVPDLCVNKAIRPRKNYADNANTQGRSLTLEVVQFYKFDAFSQDSKQGLVNLARLTPNNRELARRLQLFIVEKRYQGSSSRCKNCNDSTRRREQSHRSFESVCVPVSKWIRCSSTYYHAVWTSCWCSSLAIQRSECS
jgi:hypothetical protein